MAYFYSGRKCIVQNEIYPLFHCHAGQCEISPTDDITYRCEILPNDVKYGLVWRFGENSCSSLDGV